jgi:hypothetical protein
MNTDIVNSSVGNIEDVQLFIENLIDRKIPVAVSWNGHARVIVAYNDDYILFADSWSRHWTQVAPIGMGTVDGRDVLDSYAGGFSTIPKYAVYTSIKDVMYFDY